MSKMNDEEHKLTPAEKQKAELFRINQQLPTTRQKFFYKMLKDQKSCADW